MKITRLFRKYNRILLMVFMSLLLVVFLIGDVLGNMFQSAPDEEVGRVFGRTVKLSDLRYSESNQRLLSNLGFEDVRSLHPLDYYLLVREAEELGVRVGRDEIRTQLAKSEAAQTVIARLAQSHSRSRDSIYDTIAQWEAVSRLAGIQLEGIADSAPRLERAYRDQNQEADVQLAVIDADAFKEKVVPPNQEEIEAYYEEARDRDDAHSEDELVYGYRQPERVQVEYLTVDPTKILPLVRVTRRDAERYFEEHAARYFKSVPSPTGSTTQPEAAATDRVPMTFEEAEERVRADCRSDKAIRQAQQIVNELRAEARRPWDAQPIGDDGYRTPPPPEALVSFEELAKKRTRDSGFEVEYHKTELVDQNQLRQERGFGMAGYGTLGQQRLVAFSLAFRVKGLYEPGPQDTVPALNLYEPSPPLLSLRPVPPDFQQREPYQAYVFRDIQVAPAGPPASLDAVAEDVRADLIEIRAYEMASKYAERLAERAREIGLTEAVAEAAELKDVLRPQPLAGPTEADEPPTEDYLKALGPTKPSGRFTRSSAFTREVGSSQKLPEAVFALTTQPASAPAGPRIALVGVANQHKWVVAQLDEVRPIYEGDFAKRAQSLAQQALQRDGQAFQMSWFGSDKIRARTRFEPLGRLAEEAAEQPAMPGQARS